MSEPPPVRLVARQTAEMLLSQIARWQALVPHMPIARMALAMVLESGIAHLPRQHAISSGIPAMDNAAGVRRPVAATAIALSMRLPPTTVRRQLSFLVEAGLLVRERSGFIVADNFLASTVLHDLLAANVEDLRATIHALAHSGYVPAITALARGADKVPVGIAARHLIAFTMRIMESSVDQYGDLVASHIVNAVIAANVAHITSDLDLAQRYAGESAPPPDAIRQPISIRAVAALVNLPFETVRRRVANLVEAAIVEVRPEGLVVPARVLTSPHHVDVIRREMHFFAHLLRTLSSLGTELAGGN